MLGSLLFAAVPVVFFIHAVVTDHTGLAFRREIVDANSYPWSSIGKIGNGAGGHCTGAVIGPTEVLTSAQCLYNHRAGRFIAAGSIHILLGYVKGEYRLHGVASGYLVPPTTDPTKIVHAGDWAVLRFGKPFPADIKPLRMASATPPPGRAVKTAGYALERLHMLTADKHCRIAMLAMEGKLIVHDCVVQPGDSGGPLLIADGDDENVIAGVNVAGPRDLDESRRWGVAVSAASITEFLASRAVAGIDGGRSGPVRNALLIRR